MKSVLLHADSLSFRTAAILARIAVANVRSPLKSRSDWGAFSGMPLLCLPRLLREARFRRRRVASERTSSCRVGARWKLGCKDARYIGLINDHEES